MASRALDKLYSEERRAWELWRKHWSLAQQAWRRWERSQAAVERCLDRQQARELAGQEVRHG